MLLVHRIMNHRHGPTGLQCGIYIKKIYVLGWCTLPILSRWATDRYATIVRLFDSYWYTNLSLTRILTVNIILRALKSFITIYNSIYIHLYANRTFSHSCNFLMQIRFTRNCLKLLKTNHLKKNQYAISCQSFPKFKSFHNYSNILEIEREFENKPKIVALIPIFGISTSMRDFLLFILYSNTMTITY